MYTTPSIAAPDPALQQKVDELHAENTKLQSDVADLQSKLAQVCTNCTSARGSHTQQLALESLIVN